MSINDTNVKSKDIVIIQRNDNNTFYGETHISGSELIFYTDQVGHINAEKSESFYSLFPPPAAGLIIGETYSITSSWAESASWVPGGNVGSTDSASWASQSLSASLSDSASNMYFNGNRNITRSPYSGTNLGTSTVIDFLNSFFFPFSSATISINGSLTYQTGSVQNITISGAVTPNSEISFGTGSVRRSGTSIYTFNYGPGYTTTDTGVSASANYISYFQVGNNGTPAVINSSTKTLRFLYPYLYGTSSVAGLSGTTLYTSMISSITAEANKTLSLVGVGTYIYFCFPKSYTSYDAYNFHTLTSIKDPSNFEILTSFEYSASVPITSSGLTNNWQSQYNVYRLKLLASPNGTYIFTHNTTAGSLT